MFLKSPDLERLKNITHAFTTRLGGVSLPPFNTFNLSLDVGDDKSSVEKNREILSLSLFCGREPFFLDQIHGDAILKIGSGVRQKKNLPHDAVITDVMGIPLVIQTADCMPVLLADPFRNVVGAVHAGWRGTALGIVFKTVKSMEREYGCFPGDLVAAMGPSIGPCCLEVGQTVFDGFNKSSPDLWRAAAKEKYDNGRKRWMLDLAEANRLQLLSAGLKKENISPPADCSCCRPELFFSYRAHGGKTGRQAAVIMLKGRLAD